MTSNHWVKQKNNLLQRSIGYNQLNSQNSKVNSSPPTPTKKHPPPNSTPLADHQQKLGDYSPDNCTLCLQGNSSKQLASNHTVKRMTEDMLFTKENDATTFVSIDQAIQRIREYQHEIRLINLSYNAIDLFSARKVLEVARECPQIEILNLQNNQMIAYHGMTRFFDYDLALLLKKKSVKEVNIQNNPLATQTKWRQLFKKNYGSCGNGKLIFQAEDTPENKNVNEGELAKLWHYFFS